MTRVPANRHSQLERLRSGRQKAIIVGGVPIPAGDNSLPLGPAELFRVFNAEVRNEVASKSDLVRALPRSRFRNAFFEEARLPLGMAVRLEDFEAGLRAAGLVGVDEICVQSTASPAKFRFQKRKVADDRIHDVSPRFFVKRAAPSEPEPLLIEDHSPEPQSGGVPVKGLSGASLDGVRDGITTTNGCGELPINRRNGEDLI